MQLNELVERDGLESISEKTNISINNLHRLLYGDFERLSRVKALGFVSILQREYGLDTTKLENSIKDYFEEHKVDDSEPILVSPETKEEKKNTHNINFFKWLFIFAFLAGIAYLYYSGNLNKFLDKKDEVKSGISDSEISKNNLNEENLKKNIIIKKDKNETKIEIKTTPIGLMQEQNGTDNNGTLKIVEEIPKDKDGKEEENKTIIISKDAGIEAPQEKSEVIDSDTTIASIENGDNTKEDRNKTKVITNITINPTRGMLWYGFINIDTGKKREFMKKVSTPFELNGGRWILTTGHGFLDIVSDKKTIEVSDRVRHYFYIDSKDIREISRKEFKKLNHGKMW
jgi:hypothetical protein